MKIENLLGVALVLPPTLILFLLGALMGAVQIPHP